MKPNFENRTVFLGDNLDFLRGMNSECVDLIYVDPPFNKKKKFTAPIGSQAEGASFRDYFTKEDVKDEWVEELRQENYELHSFLSGVKAMGNSYSYCYLVYMAIRIIECHRILKKTGSFYLHCDPTMSHYLKLLLDCVFGDKQFRNEIVWCYKERELSKKYWNKKHDTILFCSKSSKSTFNWKSVAEEYSEYTINKKFKHTDEHGKKYRLRYKDGRNDPAVESEDTYRQYLGVGVPPRDWLFMPILNQASKERTGWPTQKPLALMEKIISASSNPGDLVIDPFCGCATTCVAAERLGRNWVGIDVAKVAWVQIEKRLNEHVPADMFRGEANFSTTPPTRGKDDIRPKKYVYVMSNPIYKGMYKVGVATDAKARLNSFQTADPKRGYKLEFKILTAHYKTLEPYIHRKFNGDHEWVPGDLADVIHAIKNYKPA